MYELLGVFLPPIIEIINKRIKDSDWRRVISVSIAIVFGLIINWFEDGQGFGTQESVVQSIMTVIASMKLTFEFYWEKTDIHIRNAGPEKPF